MKVGDTKKAAALSAVALIVVGAAIFQIIPKSPKPMGTVVARADGEVAATTEKKANEELPTTLTSQPFSKLKPPAPPKTDSPKTPPPAQTEKRLRSAGPFGNVPLAPSDKTLGQIGLAPDGAGIGGNPDSKGTATDPQNPLPPAKGSESTPKNPGENTGDNRQPKSEQPTLTLNGVLDANGMTAMITISQKTDTTLECKVGSRVAEFVVTEIKPDRIVLRRGNTTLKLTVGSSHPL